MLNNEGLSGAPTSLPLEQSILCAWYLCPSVSFAYTPPWYTAELRQLQVLGQRLQRLCIKTGLGCSLTNVSRSYSPPKAKSSYYTTQGHQHGEGNTRTLQCWDHLKPPSAATSQSLPFNSKSNTLHEQLVSVNTTQTNLHQPNSLKPWRAVGSALGILLFIIYLHTLGNIFWHYGINFSQLCRWYTALHVHEAHIHYPLRYPHRLSPKSVRGHNIHANVFFPCSIIWIVVVFVFIDLTTDRYSIVAIWWNQ